MTPHLFPIGIKADAALKGVPLRSTCAVAYCFRAFRQVSSAELGSLALFRPRYNPAHWFRETPFDQKQGQGPAHEKAVGQEQAQEQEQEQEQEQAPAKAVGQEQEQNQAQAPARASFHTSRQQVSSLHHRSKLEG